MLFRSIKIVYIFSKYLIFYKLNSNRSFNFGKRLRISFESLGVTFIKIGQILSMRYDLLSKSDCVELQKLLDDTNRIEFEVIKRIVEEEYKKPIGNVFKEFDEKPLGSASISQVHKAILHDGTVVAVKVKRPLVDLRMSEDLRIFKAISYIAIIFSPTMRSVQLPKMVDYFGGWIKEDIDFVNEVKNIELVYSQYDFLVGEKIRGDLGMGIFPLPYKDFCTDNIIVMDYIDGVTLNNIESVRDNKDYDIEKSVKTYMNGAHMNLFNKSCYVFQVDPHLSNIMALPGGNVSNIDCGLIKTLNEKETAFVKRLMVLVYVKDTKEVTKGLLEASNLDYKKYRPIIEQDIEDYLDKIDKEGIGFWFMEVARIFARKRVKFPLFLIEYGRCVIILDGLVATVLPGKTTLDLLGEELKKEALKMMIEDLSETDVIPLIYNVSKRIKDLPNELNKIICNPEDFVINIRNFIRN
jgi:ubiquinone biosynthesis protein